MRTREEIEEHVVESLKESRTLEGAQARTTDTILEVLLDIRDQNEEIKELLRPRNHDIEAHHYGYHGKTH